MSSTDNVELFLRFHRDFVDGGDLAAGYDTVRPDVRLQHSGVGGCVGVLRELGQIEERPFLRAGSTIEDMHASLGEMRRAFHGFRHEGHVLTATEHGAAGHWTLSGTHAESFLGLPPNGRSFRVTETGRVTIEGGKITEMWFLADQLAFLDALGFRLDPSRHAAP